MEKTIFTQSFPATITILNFYFLLIKILSEDDFFVIKSNNTKHYHARSASI